MIGWLFILCFFLFWPIVRRHDYRAPPFHAEPRDCVVERALTIVRNLPANRLAPDHVAFDVFNRLSMTESRLLASQLRKAVGGFGSPTGKNDDAASTDG